ncbi:MAG: hypothetical protein MUC29_12660 [Pyrinomonadaceae bacterium]|nr:hypothetical protein [Pyrinomonadaceae bacterium]
MASIIELEAKYLSRIWTSESIKNSLSKYLLATNKWKEQKQHKNAINCLIESVYLYEILGKQDEALNLIEQGLEITKKENLFEERILLSAEKARILIEKGNYNLSSRLINESLSASSKITSFHTKSIIFFCAGEFFYSQREISKSIDYYNKAIEEAKNLPTSEILPKSQLFLGYTFLYENNFTKSEELLTDSLNNFTKISNSRGKGLALIALAGFYSIIGEKQKALKLYQDALNNFPNNIDFVDKGRLLNGIGLVHEDYEQFDISIDYRKNALNAFETASHDSGKLATLIGLGKLYRLSKSLDKAREHFELSKTLAIKLNDKFLLAVIDEELGHLFFEQTEFSKARQRYIYSLTYFQQNNNYREISLITEKLGEIDLSENLLQKSRLNFENSIQLNRKINNKFAESQLNFNFAKLNYLENNSNEALKNITESINLTETLYSDVANSNLKRSYFSNVYDRYELYIHLLMQRHKESPNENFALQALQASEKSRSRSLLETLRLSEANFTKDANPQTVQKEKELLNLLNLKANKLTELLSSNAEQSEIDKVDEERRTLENELETVRAELKQQSPIYSTIKNPPPFDVAEFQQNSLDGKSVLLEFAFGEKESYLWLIGKNEVSSYVLPPREVLENRIEKIRKSFDEILFFNC